MTPPGATHALKLVLECAGLTLVLVVLSGIGASALPASAAGDGTTPAPPMAVVLGVMGLQVVALALLVVGSRWTGWRLAATLFLVHFGTVTFLSQIESLVYLGDQMPEGLVAGLFVMGLFTAAAFAPLAVWVLGRWRAPSPAAAGSEPIVPRREWAWKVPLAGALFVALYYLFGYYVAWKNPAVRAYYGGTDPGGFLAQMASVVRTTPWMLPFQFARGLLWVGLGLLAIRSLAGPWWRAGLTVALLFAVPSVYLLFPNPFMPDAVRLSHLAETLPYQFLFGWILAWLFARHRPAEDGAQAFSTSGA